MAKNHLGRNKKSVFPSPSELKMNRSVKKAMNYRTGLTNIKKFTRQKLMG